MQPQIRTDFCVTVFPGGNGWKDSNPAHIYFASAIQKSEYVDAERTFCSKEMAAFNGAISKKSREEARKNYLKRRAFFAVHMGYGPSMRDNSLWFHKPPVDKVTA